ncbi:MAG: PD-(D/E)XK nuclease family protein [Christensenellales bacterium]|jgi:ATP-dependent helicase/nuclease subunit B
MLQITAGRARGAGERLIRETARALKARAGQVYIVVPKQLTLETELLLIRALESAGSLRLNVLSPERLCARIFESAGRASFERVDDRGRVLVARRAIRACAGELRAYRRAGGRRGFPARVARQLELFRQAQLTPDDVRALADGEEGLFSAKLSDMAAILEAYENALAGRSLDGEAEFLDAAARAAQSDVVKSAGIIFYGFDVMPRPLHALAAALAAACDVTMLVSADPDPDAPDADVFAPVNRALDRLAREAKLAGAQRKIEPAPPAPAAPPDIAHAERYLYAARAVSYEEDVQNIRLSAHQNLQAEAMYAAGRCRALAMAGMRWNDMLLICPDAAAYAHFLEDAFGAHGIPIFLSSSRPASRHALAEALLSAISLVAKGFRTEDARALLRTGYAGVDGADADLLANYMVKYAPRGRALTTPFIRGGEEAALAEPMREALIAPVLALRARLREAKTLKDQLAALFSYLEDISAYDKSMEMQQRLMDANLYRLAGEQSQVWNRILSALDQAASLMGEKRLPLAEIAEMLRESLDAAVIKPLPQSGDAVYAQSADRAVSRSAKFVMLIGLTDRAHTEIDGLFGDYQLARLTRASGRYLGPDGSERALMRRYYLKSALGAAREQLEFTYPLSAADGSAQRPAPLINDLKRLFPRLIERGSARDAASVLAHASPNAALRAVGGMLGSPAGIAALSTIAQEPGGAVKRLLSAFDARRAAEQLRPDTAQRIYGALSHASVTRLEAFARCPMLHFMRYAMSPIKTEPFELTVRDEGNFFHDAVRGFLEEARFELPDLDVTAAGVVMDAVSDILLERMAAGDKFATAIEAAERRRLKATARAAAEALVRQLAGSAFQPVELELEFGRGDASAIRLSVPGGDCTLEGRIDRVDEWAKPDEGFLRVIDYKRGGAQLKLFEAYYGLQLQLITYLAAATARRGKEGAGVYYFKIDEGIVTDQSTNPEEIEKKRRDAMKLKGLTTDEPEVIAAMSPRPQDVISIRIRSDGTIVRSGAIVDRQAMRLIIDRALHNAARHVAGIRAGHAEASPARTQTADPCKYCDYRRSCLFDDSLDARKVRRVETMNDQAVIDRLKTEGARADEPPAIS